MRHDLNTIQLFPETPMNVYPLLACGPGAEIYYAVFAVLGLGALSCVSGIVCLCMGSKTIGALLFTTPIALFGLLYFCFTRQWLL